MTVSGIRSAVNPRRGRPFSLDLPWQAMGQWQMISIIQSHL